MALLRIGLREGKAKVYVAMRDIGFMYSYILEKPKSLLSGSWDGMFQLDG